MQVEIQIGTKRSMIKINKLLGILIYFIGHIFLKLNFSDFRINFNKLIQLKSQINSDFELPNFFLDCIIVAEDKRFYNHFGFDFYGIVRAFFHNISYNKFEGASTIDQQLIRTVTQEKQRNLKRKVKEIILATQLKKLYSKNEVIYLYLINAYFGTELVGVKSAIKKYKKEAKDLSNIEIAEIISRLKYPESSKGYMKKIEMRSKYILMKFNK